MPRIPVDREERVDAALVMTGRPEQMSLWVRLDVAGFQPERRSRHRLPDRGGRLLGRGGAGHQRAWLRRRGLVDSNPVDGSARRAHGDLLEQVVVPRRTTTQNHSCAVHPAHAYLHVGARRAGDCCHYWASRACQLDAACSRTPPASRFGCYVGSGESMSPQQLRQRRDRGGHPGTKPTVGSTVVTSA
jgi:hypothetical protein